MSALKATFWFGAGMATSELLMRWPIHLTYLVIIASLVWGRHIGWVCA